MSAFHGFGRLFVRQSASGLNVLLTRLRGASACSSSRAVLQASFGGPTRAFGCVSLSPILPSQSRVPARVSFERVVQHALSHTRRPQKGMPLAQGVAFLASKGQLTRQHLMTGMSQLAEVFIDNAHTYSVEELSAWCEICRQLEFVGSERNHLAMTEAVCSALEGRMSELQPSELPGVAWMLASADMPLPPAMEKELVRSITNQCEELTAEECLILSEAVSRLSMGHHKDLASALARTAAHSLRDCDPPAAIRLAATALPATLPHTAPERGMLVSSLAAHMKSREKQYLSDHHTLEQALSLVVDLAAGQPALQEYVRAVQHMAHCLPQDAFRPLEPSPLCAHAM